MENIRKAAIELLSLGYDLNSLLNEAQQEAPSLFSNSEMNSMILHLKSLSLQLDLPLREVGTQLVIQEIKIYVKNEPESQLEKFENLNKMIEMLIKCPDVFDADYFGKILKHMYIPLEILWCMDVHKIISMNKYILCNMKNPENLASFTRDLTSFVLPPYTALKAKIGQSVLQNSLNTLCLTSYALKSSSSNKHMSRLATVILDTFQRKLFDFMKNNKTETLIRNVYSLLQNTVERDICKLMAISSIKNMLSYSPSLTASDAIVFQNEWSYSKIRIDLRSMMSELCNLLSSDEALDVMFPILEEKEVNWEYALSLISVLTVTKSDFIEISTGRLVSVLERGLEAANDEKLILSVLLVRQICLDSNKYLYEKWFCHSFCRESSPLSKKAFICLIKLLTDIVKYETLLFLEVHVKHNMICPPGYQNILSDYLSLAKTRILDLKHNKEVYVEPSMVGEVEKIITDYSLSGVLPGYLLETSIFRKAYFTNSFLPAIKLARNDVNKRHLLEALLDSGRISDSDYDGLLAETDCEMKPPCEKQIELNIKEMLDQNYNEKDIIKQIDVLLKSSNVEEVTPSILNGIMSASSGDESYLYSVMICIIPSMIEDQKVLNSVLMTFSSYLNQNYDTMSLNKIKVSALLLTAMTKYNVCSSSDDITFVNNFFENYSLGCERRRWFYLKIATEYLRIILIHKVDDFLSEGYCIPRGLLLRFQFLLHRTFVDKTSGIVTDHLKDVQWLESYKISNNPTLQELLNKSIIKMNLSDWLNLELTTDHEEFGSSPSVYFMYLKSSILGRFWTNNDKASLDIILQTLVTGTQGKQPIWVSEFILLFNNLLSTSAMNSHCKEPLGTVIRNWMNCDSKSDHAFCRIITTLQPWLLLTDHPGNLISEDTIATLHRLINTRFIHSMHDGIFLSGHLAAVVINAFVSLGEITKLKESIEHCPCLKLSVMAQQRKITCLSNLPANFILDLGLSLRISAEIEDNVMLLRNVNISCENKEFLFASVIMQLCWQWLLSNGNSLEKEDINNIVECIQNDANLWYFLDITSKSFLNLVSLYPQSVVKVYPIVAIQILHEIRFLLSTWDVGDQILYVSAILENLKSLQNDQDIVDLPFFLNCCKLANDIMTIMPTNILASVSKTLYENLPSELQHLFSNKSLCF